MKKTLFAFSFAVAAMVSCSKAELSQPAVEQKEGVTSFSAVMEAPEDDATKAVVVDKVCTWEVGDEIAVSDGTTKSLFTLTSISAGKASFSLKEGEAPLASGATYKAWYPAGIAPVEGVSNLPQQQVNRNGEIPDGKNVNYSPSEFVANPMYAESTGSDLVFKNLCAIIKISLSVPDGDADVAIAQIIMESYDKPLFGPYTVESDAAVLSASDLHSYNRIASRNGNSKFVSAVKDYYLAVPAGTYTDCEFILQSNKKMFQNFRLKAGKTLDLQRNKLYSLSFVVDDITTYSNLDGGNDQTANCYMFKSAAGKYQFKATKGNDFKYIEGIDHVGILWKSQNDQTDLTDKVVKSVSYKNGYVRFETSNNQGNAVIAAYNAGNEVLWSWHIWAQGDQAQDVQIAEGVKILDRNLGALASSWSVSSAGYYSSYLSSGLYYQWGRKDPFPSRVNSDKQQMKVDGTAMSVVKEAATVGQAVGNPTVFYANGGSHWCSETEASWAGEAKSVYDPCPFGYRVPAKSDLVDVWAPANMEEKKEAANSTKTAILGFTLNAGGNKVWFPTTGQISSAGALTAGTTILTTTTAATANTDCYSRFWTREEDHTFFDAVSQVAKGKTIEAETKKTIRAAATVGSYGMTVRCVKE
ncbi:MAG: hypothetical protein KBS67_04535 [Bacteroidales bacterium]|nr:hypothetical protein [Candidatus Cryptobacteroides equifaecalis]